MAARNAVEIRIGGQENVLEIQAGTVEVDVPRSVGGYIGGLAVTVGAPTTRRPTSAHREMQNPVSPVLQLITPSQRPH